jgi:hypothetical protein
MWNSMTFCDAVLKVIEGQCPGMVTLDLSNNMIRSLAPLRRLGHVAKALVNLNLQANDIKATSEITQIKSCAGSLHR